MNSKKSVLARVLFCAFFGGAGFATVSQAEGTASTSNDPSSGLNAAILKLMDDDRSHLAGLSGQRAATIAAPVNFDAAKAGRIVYEAKNIAAMPVATGGPEWACLTEALYFESRGETVRGQIGVAEVILNRVDSKRFPNSVCGVVHQGAHRRNACQFSYACDGKPEVMHDRASYHRSGKIARMMLNGAPRQLVDGATFFHTVHVKPSWARKFRRTAKMGVHLFYSRG